MTQVLNVARHDTKKSIGVAHDQYCKLYEGVWALSERQWETIVLKGSKNVA